MKKNRNDAFPDKGNLLRILLRMKLTFILLVCAMVQLFAVVNAQTVSLKKQNASLEEIIWELKAKTHLVFLYSDEDIASVKGIDIDVRNVMVDEVLEKCLEGTGLQCVKENGAIIIKQVNSKVSVPQVQNRKITGKVTAKGGMPLPGVTVLIDGTSVGVTTDAAGKYTLECPSQGEWVLQFTFIGMKTQKLPVGEKTEINVIMTEDMQEMEEEIGRAHV